MKTFFIKFIKNHQYYEDGVLESKTFNELREIYNDVIDWILGC